MPTIRVPSRFFGIRNFPFMKLVIRDFKAKSARKFARDDGIEEPYVGGHVAAAWKRDHQWCVSLTPNNTRTIGRMICHCFLRPIRGDVSRSPYTTGVLHYSQFGTLDDSLCDKRAILKRS